MHLFSKYLLSSKNVADTVLDTEALMVNKKLIVSFFFFFHGSKNSKHVNKIDNNVRDYEVL